jgi:hypothetical protein
MTDRDLAVKHSEAPCNELLLAIHRKNDFKALNIMGKRSNYPENNLRLLLAVFRFFEFLKSDRKLFFELYKPGF